MSDRIPSSFPAAPPSPSSPAPGSLKENHQLAFSSDHIPQTPTSPPLMSVSDQNHVSNFASSQASQAITQPPTTSPPPSSTPMSTQVSQQPTMSATNSFPTPASSVSGQLAQAPSSEDAERKPLNSAAQDSTGNMEGQQQTTEHTRTDHDRHNTAPDTQTFDPMDLDKDPILSRNDTRNLGLESLQNEFTSAFHLCKSCKIPLSLTSVVDMAAV